MTARRLVASANADAVDADHTIAFPEPVALRAPDGGPSGLLLDVVHVFRIVAAEPTGRRQWWRVTTRMYEYRLLDRDQRELLVYHWQPGSDFEGPDHPHLHVSATINALIDAAKSYRIVLDKRHIATGRVSLEAVVRMLIVDFEVAPQRHDWRDILVRTESVFQDEATRWL